MPGDSRLLTPCTCLVLALFASSLSAQTRILLGRFDTLTLTLSVPAHEFLVLEPVPLTLTLENRTTRGVRGHMALEFLARRVDVVVQPDGSPPHVVKTLTSVPALVDITGRIIKPGERREVTQLLTLELDQVLPRPGRYLVRAVLHGIGPREAATSNGTWITVREPDRFEQEAYEYMVGTGLAGYFFTDRTEPELLALREEIAERFTETPYADYANLLLGEDRARRGDAMTARKYLSRIAGKPEFPLAARAAKRLAELTP